MTEKKPEWSQNKLWLYRLGYFNYLNLFFVAKHRKVADTNVADLPASKACWPKNNSVSTKYFYKHCLFFTLIQGDQQLTTNF